MKITKIWPEPHIVAIGGGSGISALLPGLKKITSKITAVITVADDGGSTGRLREDMGIIAPGDIRNCLVALANTDKYMKQLFDYRFASGDLEGHSFGNLFIAAMSDIYKDFGKAVYRTGEVLSITGKVLPLTLENTDLIAELENGEMIRGESKIPEKVIESKSKIKQIKLDPEDIEIFEDAKKDILEADIVIFGPGSLYTSLIPNLLAKDMVDLILQSRAKVYYIVNAVTQEGETTDYSVYDHYKAIIDHAEKKFIDSIIVNKKIPKDEIIGKYHKVNSDLVILTDEERRYFEKENIEIIEDDIIEIKDGKIRHYADKIAKVLFNHN